MPVGHQGGVAHPPSRELLVRNPSIVAWPARVLPSASKNGDASQTTGRLAPCTGGRESELAGSIGGAIMRATEGITGDGASHASSSQTSGALAVAAEAASEAPSG